MAKNSPLLVALVGPKAARLSLDDFYRDRSHLPPARRASLNFDHPRAIDCVSFERVLRHLRAGRPTRVPRYDFTTHSRLPATILIKPKPIILVDGLWLLRRPSLRRLFGMRIFLDCPFGAGLPRRLARDLRSRGRTAASIRAQFRKTVEPMHRSFVVPQMRWADMVLKDTGDMAQVARIATALKPKSVF